MSDIDILQEKLFKHNNVITRLQDKLNMASKRLDVTRMAYYNAKEPAEKATRQAEIFYEKTSSTFVKFVRWMYSVLITFLRWLYNVIGNILNAGARDLNKQVAKYFVFVVIIAMIVSFTFAAAGDSKGAFTTGSVGVTQTSKISQEDVYKIDAAKRKNMSTTEVIQQTLRKWWQYIKSFFDFGYKFNSTLKMFGSFDEATIDRPRFFSGRCDNIEYVQVPSQDGTYGGLDVTDGKQGACITSTKPKPIEWDLTSELQSSKEFTELPESIKNSPEVQQQTKIKIPYYTSSIGNIGSFWVPQCQKAYYVDKSGTKREVNMFDSDNVQCRPKSIPIVKISGSDPSIIGQPRQSVRSKYCPV